MGTLVREHGSGFAYPAPTPHAAPAPWLPGAGSYWHSGRHALRALIRALVPARVWFPSFYCQDVLDAADGVEVVAYADRPPAGRGRAALAARPGDLVVVSNTYGLRPCSPVSEPAPGVTVVEDHTHDPLSAWARRSTAPYAFASLRKWLPLPDGALLWSPTGAPVPQPPAFDPAEHAAAAAATLDAVSSMLLKQRYLAGEPVAKADYRRRAGLAEAAMGLGDPAPISPLSRSLLDVLPVHAWRAARRRNHAAFVRALGRPGGVEVLTAGAGSAAGDPRVPFAVVLRFADPGRRALVRDRLVEQAVYPAVLWPLDADRCPGLSRADTDLAARVLCLHCDHRYDAADMAGVAAAVRAAIGSTARA